MLARLQQFTTLSLVALAVAWAAYFAHRRQTFVALVGALLIVFAYAFVLGAETLLLRRVNRSDPAPSADAPTLLKAWGSEVIIAARVFCWYQPFRSLSVPDELSSTREDAAGIVFVHGFACNRGIWLPWLRRLRALDIPFVAVDLEPVFAGIDSYVAIVDAGVSRLHASTGRRPIIVAHSMGGLAVRAWLAAHDAESRVEQVITIGTPHHGTVLARLAMAANATQMRRKSDWLAELARREPETRVAAFICYYSHCDNVVMPASSATLPGADNRHLPGVGHVSMTSDERILKDILVRVGAASREFTGTPHGGGSIA